jgi:nucleotide-binding universal stress UspA family protein
VYARIVVPIDGSDFGDFAIPFAIAIARRSAGDIELVHVHRVQDEEPYLGGLTPYQFQGELRREFDYERKLVEEEIAWLRSRAAQLVADSGVSVTERILDGGVAGALQREAERLNADLIVMATHARRGVNRWRHGSVGDALVRHSDRPVLLVRTGERPQPSNEPDLRSILIPLDGSPFSEQVLEPAVALAKFLRARVTLFHAYLPAGSAGDWEREGFEPRAQGAEEYLNSVADRLTALDERPTVRWVANAHPANAILDLLENEIFDLVAMATHGRGGVTRMLAGSNADQILSATHVPAFLIRPRTRGTDQQVQKLYRTEHAIG